MPMYRLNDAELDHVYDQGVLMGTNIYRVIYYAKNSPRSQ